MTTTGVFLLDPEAAVVWSDAEVWEMPASAASHHAPKLSFNNLICACGAGAGFSDVSGDAGEAVAKARNFDDLVPAVTASLRRAVFQHGYIFDRRPSDFVGQTYVVAGWSHRAGRMLAYEFRSETFFAATLTTRTLCPEVDGLPSESWKPPGPAALLDLARKQMAVLRKSGLKGAGTGALSIAHIQPDRLSLQTFPDFDAEARANIDAEKEPC